MDRQFEELIKTRSFEDIKSKELPTLQRPVYEALKDLLPARLDYILRDYPKLTINHSRLNQDTYYLICRVMIEVMDNPRLLLTQDDLLCCWQRFKELVFLHQAVKQGIIIERSADDGSATYWGVLPKEPLFQPNVGTTIINVSRCSNMRVWRK